MLDNIKNKDIRARGYVLRRTNYGEADRILNIITPVGKIAAIAKGVRKEKSKLAGGVEMFTLSEFNIHIGKGDLGVITSARMVKYYDRIIRDLNKVELASVILKGVSKASEHSGSSEFFGIVEQGLAAINLGEDLRMVEAWYLLNLKKVIGEEMNLYRDIDGVRLLSGERYDWDTAEMVFVQNEHGRYGTDEIKLMRLMVSSGYDVVQRIKIDDDMPGRILQLVRTVI